MKDDDKKKETASKRMLQLILGFVSMLAFYTAYLGYAYGAVNWYYGFTDSQVYTKGLMMLDSNVRFFSGLWLGVGIVLIWLIPRIAKDKTALRILAVLFFFGGVGRLISILTCGLPSFIYLFYVLLEFCFPFLILWQNRIFQLQSK